MQVQTNTDRTIHGSASLAGLVEQTLAGALGALAERITRVEVHLGDENGSKGGAADKRCTMEARLEGRPPSAVTHHAPTIEEAIDGAATKLVRSIRETLERLRGH
jgi:hypothetical protein